MIRGLKGARKARIQRSGMGKRGGGRVVYYVQLGTDWGSRVGDELVAAFEEMAKHLKRMTFRAAL
jgi:hypothetical protein